MTVPYMKLWTTITHTLRFYDSAIGEELRAVTPISIATLIVSIAALVLIIILATIFVSDGGYNTSVWSIPYRVERP